MVICIILTVLTELIQLCFTEKGYTMILLDYKDRRPIYEQIVEKLSDLMVRGILAENTPLPSVRALATDLSINPNTVQRAYLELERRGYIYSQKGKGSFVAGMEGIRSGKQAAVIDELDALVSRAFAAGISESYLTQEIRRRYASESQKTKGGNADD